MTKHADTSLPGLGRDWDILAVEIEELAHLSDGGSLVPTEGARVVARVHLRGGEVVQVNPYEMSQ